MSHHPADAIVPTYRVFELLHALKLGNTSYDGENLDRFRKELLALIEKDSMSYFYLSACEELQWPVDGALLQKMRLANQEALNKIEVSMARAERQFGDAEVLDCHMILAHHFCRIGDYKTAEEKYLALMKPPEEDERVPTCLRDPQLVDEESVITADARVARGEDDSVSETGQTKTVNDTESGAAVGASEAGCVSERAAEEPLPQAKEGGSKRRKGLESTARINVCLTLARIQLFTHHSKKAAKYLAAAEKDLETGGDWETRKRFRVYRGIHLAMNERRTREAADLLVSALATFTATELLSFPEFVKLTLVLSIASLPRPALKQHLYRSPELLQVLASDSGPAAAPLLAGQQAPPSPLLTFLNAFVESNFRDYFRAYARVADWVRKDMFVSPHYRYLVKQLRLVAYSQYLKPYKSVTITAMADAFGVSPAFIEREVVSLIPTGSLDTRVDKVDGTFNTNIRDASVCGYREALGAGDELMNKIQTLSRVIDM